MNGSLQLQINNWNCRVNAGREVVAYTTLLKGLCEAGHIDESREAAFPGFRA